VDQIIHRVEENLISLGCATAHMSHPGATCLLVPTGINPIGMGMGIQQRKPSAEFSNRTKLDRCPSSTSEAAAPVNLLDSFQPFLSIGKR
jgi:hypothetical protein